MCKYTLLLILCLAIEPLIAQGLGRDPDSGSRTQSAATLLQETVERLQQRQYQAATQVISTYLQLYPEHYRAAEAKFYRSIASYHMGQVQQARKGFDALLRVDPEEASRFGALYWLGLISFRLGEVDTAHDLWLRQLALRTANAADYRQQTYLALAQVMKQRGDESAALRYYRLLEGPTRRRAGFIYGSLALRQGLYHEAYNAFSAYLIQPDIQSGPSRAQALFYRGQSAFFAGLLRQAKQSLDTVLKLYSPQERLFLAALIMRLRLALEEKDGPTAQRFYDQAVALEQRYRHGMKTWLNAVKLPLFILQGQYSLALKHMRSKPRRGRTEREIARFNIAMVQAFIDKRLALRQFHKLRKSFIPDIRERTLFQIARLQIPFLLTRAEGVAQMEAYLQQYPQGFYAQEAVRILLTMYRSDPGQFWLQSSRLLEELRQHGPWPQTERARFYLYWAEMARQLNNDRTALKYWHQSWKLAPRKLVGLQAHYRSGAFYFGQRQYSRALGYFREVQLQLAGLQFASSTAQSEAEELSFYTELAIAQAYVGAGQARQALRQFQQLIQKSHNAQHNVQQAQLQLGLVYFYQQAYQQAVDTFDAIISAAIISPGVSSPGKRPNILVDPLLPDHYPPVLLALYWKGEALFRQGLFAAARQSFHRINEIYPEALGANAYLRAALAAKAAEDYASVIEDLQQARAFIAEDNLQQWLNVDFHLVKYNLLLGRDNAAIEAAKHMLKSVPSTYDLAYNLIGEAFSEIAELYFNRGDLDRSQTLLTLLEQRFIRNLPPRAKRAKLEGKPLEPNPSAPHSTPHIVGSTVTDSALSANLRNRLFSFDTEKFLRRYSVSPAVPKQNSSAVLDNNIHFYVQNRAGDIPPPSIFSALYLLGIIYAEKQNFLVASQYFLQYLKKDPHGSYAISAVSSLLRLLPKLATEHRDRLYSQIKAARLGAALDSILFARYWSLQTESAAKKRALEQIIEQTISINARKEAMYHLSVHHRKQGNMAQAQQLLLDLRHIQGGRLALDPENYWAGLANLELGRMAYLEGKMGEAKVFFQTLSQQAQIGRETLAEALYWLANIARFEGNTEEAREYRQNLQNLDPSSEWLRKL